MFKSGENVALSGKVVNDIHYKRLCELFKDHGGEVVLGNRNAHLNNKLTFSVILNPKKDSPLMQDEIFGPIFPLLTYSNFD